MYNISIEFKHGEPLTAAISDEMPDIIAACVRENAPWITFEEIDGREWSVRTDEIVTINMIGGDGGCKP